jgi:type IV pilus assembly protein PilE
MIQSMKRRVQFREQLMRKRQSGVTLMELLTVILVVSILGTLAVGSYRRYLMRAQRSDATTSLMQLQQQQEKHFLQYGVYVTATGSMGNSHATGGLGMPSLSPRGYYNLTLAATAIGYTATATPVSGGGQAADRDCASFTITESGTKSAVNSGGTDNTQQCYR